MGCSTLHDYTMLYLRTDVLHLTDIYEEFRETCLKNYQLDPCWYYTTPGLSWSAMLKFTGVKLEFIKDQSILEFFESQIRGGLSMIFHRKAEANNKYLSHYDSEKNLPI